MNFLEPDWLYLLAVPLVLMPILALIGRAKRQKALAALLGANANSPESVHLSRGRRFWRQVLICCAVFFITAACARPSLYSRLLPFEAKGRDLLVLCDVSRSMNAADIAPSRLQHARYLLRQLAAREKGDRFGLVPFAGNAYLSCPLTSDPVTFNEYVDDLSTDSVPAGGTNLERAFKVALKAFEGSGSNNRAILLLTDGEELQGDIKAVTGELLKRQIPVFAVGFGDPAKGTVIPLEPGKAPLLRDKEGKLVTTRLNEKLLSALANSTKGLYIRTTATDPGLVQLESAIDALDRRGRGSVKNTLPVEEFPKALAAALGALLLFLLLSERKSLVLLLVITPVMMWSAPEPAGAQAKNELALPEKKAELPQTPESLYNQALTLQKEGKEGSEELYRKVISQLPAASPLRGMSFFNLGVGMHNRSRTQSKEIDAQLKGGRLQESLKTIGEASALLDGAEELYAASVSGGAAPLKQLPANLTRLAKERKALEELKKKIEELLKQQQKAQQDSRSARDQNRQKPQDQQQRRQQKESIDKAQQQSRKLQEQAKELKQQEMEKSAQKAAEELKKAADAKEKGDDRKSSQHIDNALRELDKQDPRQEKAGNKNAPQQQKKDPGNENKGPRNPPQAAPQPENRKGAEQMLELMGEDDKKLRSAIKERMRLNRTQVEKDW